MHVLAILREPLGEVLEYVSIDEPRREQLIAVVRRETARLRQAYGLPRPGLELFEGDAPTLENFFDHFYNVKLTERSIHRTSPPEPAAENLSDLSDAELERRIDQMNVVINGMAANNSGLDPETGAWALALQDEQRRRKAAGEPDRPSDASDPMRPWPDKFCVYRQPASLRAFPEGGLVKPTRLGKYDVGAQIDAGEYRAHDSVSGRPVVIIVWELGDDDDLLPCLLEEAQSVARLNHPNIVTIHDFGVEKSLMYIATEFLEGPSLRELIARDDPLPLDEKLALMDQVCDGLACAHAREVVHGDLRPSNIHVLPTGQVKISDFGARRIASLLARGQSIIGSPWPSYLSPEQVRGQGLTTSSDVFSLGSLFYELLSGRVAFDNPSFIGVLFQIMEQEPPPLETVVPELPMTLCAVVKKALAKDPALRYADAGELRTALRVAVGRTPNSRATHDS